MSVEAKRASALVAAAAAGLLLAGCAHNGSMVTSMNDGTVHCKGVNACKGQTSCKSATNDCKGKNNCKGQGWLGMSEKECEAKGGTVI